MSKDPPGPDLAAFPRSPGNAFDRSVTDPSHNDLASILSRGLDTPLRALRVALEEMRSDTGHVSILPGAIEAVGRLQREVNALKDYLVPSDPAPMSCSTRQVAACVRDLLGGAGEVLVAHEGRPASLYVDPLLFAKSMARLLESEDPSCSGPSMLHVRTHRGTCRFTLVGRAPRTLDGDHAPLTAQQAERFGFTLALVARDLTRLGACASFRIGTSGIVLADVEIAVEEKEQEAA